MTGLKIFKSLNKQIRHALISSPIVMLICLLYFLNSFDSVENDYEDRIYQHPSGVPSDIVIIGIDEKALEEIGPLSSWKRKTYADLINAVYSGEDTPAVLGVDMEFFGRSDEGEDGSLVDAVKGRNVVLSSRLDISGPDGLPIHSGDLYVESENRAFYELDAVSKRGFTNTLVDQDGILRRVYTSVSSGGDTYDSFPVAILKATGTEIKKMPPVVELMYCGIPGDFETVSAADVLNGKIPASHFKDSVVLIGAYDEGLMDAYRTPMDHGTFMNGVEILANTIQTFRTGRIIRPLNIYAGLLIFVVFMSVFSVLEYRNNVLKNTFFLGVFVLLYAFLCFVLFRLFFIKLPVMYLPLGLILLYLAALIVRHVEAQTMLATEMKQTLFSMADSLAEAVEGRTPYNANHTKNVAKRSVEVLRYMNEQHKKGRTKHSFTENDMDQMYLAAMLHDIGKLDVPLEIMDKPTKLGNREDILLLRLEIIRLHISNDLLSGRIKKEDGENKIAEIEEFTEKLTHFNSGKPLSDEESAFIRHMGEMKYISEDGNIMSYLTKEETDDLMIRAGTLSDEERKVMQSHVIFTNKILSHVHFGQSFDKVGAMASNHHELLNGKGYPNGLGKDKLDAMTRILTIMDIFDSLTADDRPYKKPKSVKEAFEILDEDAAAGRVDAELLGFVKELYF